MIGIGDRDYVAIRFEAFLDEVLAPAAVVARAPLELERRDELRRYKYIY